MAKMKQDLTRRRFLKEATAAGGAAVLEAAVAPVASARAAAPATRRPTAVEIARAYQRAEEYEDIVRQPVYRAHIDPHWFAQGTRFWYRNDGPKGSREFIVVDAERGIRGPAFAHDRLAAALRKASGKKVLPGYLPLDALSFSDDGKTVRFRAGDQDWQCDLAAYICTPAAADAPSSAPGKTEAESARGADRGDGVSPDGRWTAFVRDHNVWIRDAGGAEKQLSHDGAAEQTYRSPRWSSDSQALVAFRTHHTAIEPVYLIESSPREGGMRGVLHEHEYAQPGDPFPLFAPCVFDITAGTATAVAADPIDFGEEPPDLVWSADGHRFLYERIDRGHQRFRIVSVDTRSGQVQTIVDERSKTFLHTSNGYTYYTQGAKEVIYASEQDGWRHLYRYDAERGGLINQITRGEWVVRDVDRVDETARQIWFRASGKNPGENPYHIHYYRVNFDGTGLVALTEGDGAHMVQFSPDRSYLIDSYSRPDLAPIHTLRRTVDGSLICALETADASALAAAGWRPPEVFHARGRDGATDIWGLVFRPRTLDPARRYPVIENIYAGPQDSFVRQSFAAQDGMQALAELGFIVVQCDGMGTRNRSKAFHDVCWRNLKDAGFPDRIAWIKALAAKYPYVDTNRVGIYGTSAGGQNSTGALLFHPEFYKVGVSSCGCHDNRIDKRWWNEQWMGYPVGPWYEDSSNITHANNLRGKLLLMVGEMDTNVPPESTLRLTDALIRADKDFDLVILTGSNHTSGGAYGERRRRDFFVRHLLGVDPPERNIPRPVPKPTTLTPRPLSEEGMAQPDGGPDTTIRFVNQTRGTVKLFWLPGDGKRTPYGSVAAGTSREMHTYSGHYWLVTDEADKPLALFVGERGPGIAEVR